MNIPVLSACGTRIGTIDTTENIASEIANVAINGGGKLLAYPTLHDRNLVSLTLAFEPAQPSERPRLVWCPPGCEAAAMKLLEECEVPKPRTRYEVAPFGYSTEGYKEGSK